MAKSSNLKLLKFPEKTHDERFMTIFSELAIMPDTEDEAYYVETLIIALENHFDDLAGDEAFMIAHEVKKLRLLIGEFYGTT